MKLKGDEFDQVVITGKKISLIASLINQWSTFSVKDQIKEMEEYWYPNLVLGENREFLEVFKDKINLNQFPFDTELGKKFDVLKLQNPYTEQDGINVSNFYKEKNKSYDSWGSCGGSWDNLNYFGTITVLKLETSSRDHSFIGDSFLDLGCQNIVVSSNDGETSLVLGHLNTLPDHLLADRGFILERQ